MKKTVIIVHEIYGISENLFSLKEKLQRNGIEAILPSLYEDNYCGVDENESYNRFYSQAGIEKGYRIIDSIIAENSNSEIHLVGFSVGAAIAWLHSVSSYVKTVIGIYGSRIRDYTDIVPAADTYLYFCNEKTFEIRTVIDKLKTREKVKIKMLNGGHGFYNSSDVKDKILQNYIDEEIFRIIDIK